MNQHPDRDQHACDVGHHPTRVGYDRQRRMLDSRPFFLEVAALIERLVGEPERVVHPNRFLFIDVPRRILDEDRRCVVAGRCRPEIVLLAHVLQAETVRLVESLRPQGQFEGLVPDADLVGLAAPRQQHADQIGANRLVADAVGQGDIGRGHVDLAVRIRAAARLFRLGEPFHSQPGRREILVTRRGRSQVRVLQHVPDLDAERKFRQVDRVVGLDHRPRNRRDTVFTRLRLVDHRQLECANVVDERGGLALFNVHLRFDRGHRDVQFVEHHQADPRMQQHDARSLAEDDPTPGHQCGRCDSPLGQLPEDSH